jgi:hypothetical protein
MTRKADFNAEEWSTVTAAPALAALAVAVADRGGTLSEGLSVARAYQAARAAEHSELLEAVLASPPGIGVQSGRDAAALIDRAEAAVLEASELLRAKATEAEVREFGDFVVAVTDAVARAHKEGGVLGFGGKEVSQPEQAVLDRLATALGPRPGGG